MCNRAGQVRNNAFSEDFVYNLNILWGFACPSAAAHPNREHLPRKTKACSKFAS